MNIQRNACTKIVLFLTRTVYTKRKKKNFSSEIYCLELKRCEECGLRLAFPRAIQMKFLSVTFICFKQGHMNTNVIYMPHIILIQFSYIYIFFVLTFSPNVKYNRVAFILCTNMCVCFKLLMNFCRKKQKKSSP